MMGTYYRIKNWERFQHYKDRNPPWIKLHRDLLASETWVSVDDASRVLAIACMLLAAATDNQIPDNPRYIQRVAYLSGPPDFGPLIEVGFLEVLTDQDFASDASKSQADASKPLAKRSASAQETETETETETEKTLPGKPDPASEIIDYLNEKSGRSFRNVKANTELVMARIREGATVDEIKAVIDGKVRAWGNDPKMAEFLRPETLFGARKFAQYAGQMNGHREYARDRDENGIRFDN
jgi:uncharacterized phage protein (TIGR02220 family)